MISTYLTDHYKLVGVCAYFYLSAVGYAYDYVYYGSGYGLPIINYVAFDDVAFSVLKHWGLIIVLFVFVGLLPYLLYRYRESTGRAFSAVFSWLSWLLDAVDAAFAAVTRAVAPWVCPTPGSGTSSRGVTAKHGASVLSSIFCCHSSGSFTCSYILHTSSPD